MTKGDQICVPVWKSKLIGFIAVTFWSLFLVGSMTILEFDMVATIGAFCFLLVSFLPLLVYGSIYICNESLIIKTPVGVFGIRLSEIETIAFGNVHIAFYGGSRRVVVPGKWAWSGEGKKSLLMILELLKKERGIDWVNRESVDILFFQKNAKVIEKNNA